METIYTIVLLMLAFSANAQRTVKGSVYDARSNEPVPFATVVGRGTTVGTTTDEQGRFTINLPAKSGGLVISYVGYT